MTHMLHFMLYAFAVIGLAYAAVSVPILVVVLPARVFGLRIPIDQLLVIWGWAAVAFLIWAWWL